MLKYRDEDIVDELPTSSRTVRAQVRFTVRSQLTRVTFWCVECERGEDNRWKWHPNCLWPTYLPVANGPRRDSGRSVSCQFRRSTLLTRTVQILIRRTVRGPYPNGPRPDTQISKFCPFSDFESRIWFVAHIWTFWPIQGLVCMHIHMMYLRNTNFHIKLFRSNKNKKFIKNTQ
jgi:hypothetical protein